MEPFVGQITLMGCNYPPRNWAFCDGTVMQITQNEALFSLLGNTFGGDGRTTFALPDLRGRIPVGPNGSTVNQGSYFGVESVTLSEAQMPAHTHGAEATGGSLNIEATAELGDIQEPTSGSKLASGEGSQAGHDFFMYNTASGDEVALGGVEGSGSLTLGPTGGSQAHGNFQPYQALNYVIALYGVYPSRD